MVHGSTGRGDVYHCPNLLELIDGSTSSCVAMDYHWVTCLNYDPCLQRHSGDVVKPAQWSPGIFAFPWRKDHGNITFSQIAFRNCAGRHRGVAILLSYQWIIVAFTNLGGWKCCWNVLFVHISELSYCSVNMYLGLCSICWDMWGAEHCH
jgi:hypothetical protein